MTARARLPLLLALLGASASCQRDLTGAPCPCADGWWCASDHKCQEGPQTQLIDDMVSSTTDGPETGNGYWYTYSDRTVPYSGPPQPLDGAVGWVSPVEGAGFDPIQDDASPTVHGQPVPYRKVDGGGETIWGVGFGMDFISVQPDGGPIPLNECEAGVVFDVDANIGIPQPFDAHGWLGVQFYARSFGDTDVNVEIHVDDDRTTPWGEVPASQHGCTVCASTSVHACSDSFADVKDPVVFPASGWTPVQVAFTSLHSGNYAMLLDPLAPIDANKIYNLHFQVQKKKDQPIRDFSLGVAYVSFYR